MKSVKFSKVSSNNWNEVSFKQLQRFIAKRSYGLSKSKHFSTRWKTLAFTVINYIRELIAQKLDVDGIHFLYARTFWRRPTSEVSASEPSRCSASVERALFLCWCTSEACKYSRTSAIVMAAAMTSCSSAILGIERKTPETCTFHGWCFKIMSIKIFKCWNSVVVFPSSNKISGYAPGCTAGIYQKIVWLVSDLINVVISSGSISYLSELTKSWIDYENFWA